MPSRSATLEPEQVHRIARALADPTRFELLRRIFAASEPLTCGVALEQFAITAATGSHHLSELEAAGLITLEKAGRYKLLLPRRDIWRAYLAQLKLL